MKGSYSKMSLRALGDISHMNREKWFWAGGKINLLLMDKVFILRMVDCKTKEYIRINSIMKYQNSKSRL